MDSFRVYSFPQNIRKGGIPLRFLTIVNLSHGFSLFLECFFFVLSKKLSVRAVVTL